MNKNIWIGAIVKQIIFVLYSVLLMFFSATFNKVLANKILYDDIASGYTNCSITNYGTYSNVTLSIGFNSAYGTSMKSRGVVFYSYSASGMQQNTKALAVYYNGMPANDITVRDNFVIYSSEMSNSGWNEQGYNNANIYVKVPNTILDVWPGIAIQAANVGGKETVLHNGGAVYIERGKNTCNLIADPSVPPEPDINISVTVPDWNLGEIKPGSQNIHLVSASQQLCLKYTDSSIANKTFVINATAQNGVNNGYYQMTNLQDKSQAISYLLVLIGSGRKRVYWPNSFNLGLNLDAGGSSCFTPFFEINTPKNIRPGIYSDVLTINIVTKA
ncbi:hypothetical protein [Erwinia sorbitola]|uniref:Spore coat protein U domain-containing protein n=1 Tax=Erwinia sorbitola TaxID=2681984 RepID=A0ABW9RGV3_9GAMM|nr:hypothetical protein [Erwinia sorbitola]MTD29274.1 hypothetical protein [Erwinia sorbitola]